MPPSVSELNRFRNTVAMMRNKVSSPYLNKLKKKEKKHLYLKTKLFTTKSKNMDLSLLGSMYS